MPIVIKDLCTNHNIAATTAGSAETLYTATACRTRIDAMTVANIGAAATTIYVYVLASGVTPSTPAAPTAVQSIAAGTTAIISDVLGHVVPVDGTIRVYSSLTLNLFVTNISGCEIS